MKILSRDLLARMPLAEAVLWAWRVVGSEQRLDAIFDEHRGRCYEGVIRFPFFVRLIADALLEHQGSGHQAFVREREAGQLPVSETAVYAKLRRIPIGLSMAMVNEIADVQRRLFPKQAFREPPSSLREFEVVTLDGKSVKRVAKRLKAARQVRGGLIGGRALVAQQYRTGMTIAMHADADGDANDVRFVSSLLPEIRSRLKGDPRLWMADAQFCDLIQIGRFRESGDHFLLRYNGKVPFYQDDTRAVQRGEADGRAYEEEWGWLGSPRRDDRAYVRRVRLIRSQEDDVLVVSDLDDPSVYPAAELLQLYKERWGIEQMFQKVTEVFSLANLIGTTAQATIFQLGFCLLLYNQLQVVRGYLAKHQRRETESISLYQVFYDAHRQLASWSTVVPPHETDAYFQSITIGQARKRLDRLLKNVWSDRWIKATNKRRRRHPKKPKTKTHSSVYRVLAAANT